MDCVAGVWLQTVPKLSVRERKIPYHLYSNCQNVIIALNAEEEVTVHWTEHLLPAHLTKR